MTYLDNDPLKILIMAFALLFTIISHELGHGIVAYWMGDDTAKRAGRLSLNPIKHIDPIGALCMFLFKFGWAKPVPINNDNFKHKKVGLFLVSVAGIFVNLLTVLITMILVMSFAGKVASDEYLSYAASIFIGYGISLASFNLIPVPPLDGSKILMSLLPDRVTDRLLRFDRLAFFVLILLVYTRILDPVIDTLTGFFYENIFILAKSIANILGVI